MGMQDKIQVKVLLADAEMRLLRLAAANQNVSASTFLKQHGLLAAVAEMRSFTPPTLPGDVSGVVTRRRCQRAVRPRVCKKAGRFSNNEEKRP